MYLFAEFLLSRYHYLMQTASTNHLLTYHQLNPFDSHWDQIDGLAVLYHSNPPGWDDEVTSLQEPAWIGIKKTQKLGTRRCTMTPWVWCEKSAVHGHIGAIMRFSSPWKRKLSISSAI
jgi:hypothetical protein